MGIPISGVDAFTERAFAGNPAAVCVLAEAREDSWFRAVAAEMNLAETAFLLPEEGEWRLRWFTPTVEVDLCGHATLASAHELWETGRADPAAPLVFRTKSGRLSASRHGPAIELDFPADPPSPAPAPPGLLESLGVAARPVVRGRFDFLVEFESEAVLRGLRPDFHALAAAGGEARGVIVTAPSSDPEFDFVSRFFAPAAGIDEDPVTGSAHCCLGPFWAARLGKTSLVGFQASRRGGVVSVRLGGGRAYLGGRAVTVWRGELS